jgi:hypothetical protein
MGKNWFEKTVGGFLEETGEFLSENAGNILSLGATAMGVPPETVAIAKTVLGAMGKKNTSAADKTNALIQSGIDAQTAYQLAALDEVKSSGQRSTAIATADKQMAYDINRGQFTSNQQNIQPYQMASLSALQSLPQLQQLLGVNAYNLPTSISSYNPPQVNFADTYAKTQEQLFPTATEAATPPSTSNPSGVGEVGSGLRASMRPENEAGVAPAGATGSTTTQTLTPYTGEAYDLNNSPLYKWQKQQMEEGLRNQLAASGLSGGTYAQRELARNEQSLAAQERERVVGNLQSLTSLGMQGANLGQASFSLPQSPDLLNAGSSQAGQIVDIYGNLGNIAGVGATQLAQNNAAAANAKNSGTSVWQDLYELGSSQDWWSGKTNSSKSSSSTPYTTSLGYTLPGSFDFKGW